MGRKSHFRRHPDYSRSSERRRRTVYASLRQANGGCRYRKNIGPADPALLAVLSKVGRIELRVPIGPEGIARLVCLGWLDRNQCQQPAVLAEVLIDFANAAV